MSAIYNELDPFAARWLRNLSAADKIARGIIDERSIADLSPADVAGPGQRHFFAGIGGWSVALRLAGVPDDADVWTGSCPCQPFSVAGRGKGIADERHLWPEWFRLIRECRPTTIFGEQVASSAGLAWLDAVFADLEGEGYACGAADLAAASVGAPHKRQRLFFIATIPEGALGDADGSGTRWISGRVRGAQTAIRGSRGEDGTHSNEPCNAGSDDYWTPAEWVECSDGFRRPIEPGTWPLVTGLSGRMGLLRGYGNAIVPQVAAEFVMAALESI